jgi:3'-phosphoadenosine 5'-phosphosulfate sulfotransferase (PAPS reductase)/FAD synthetase
MLPVVASVSGGKDSTAMCLHLKEQEIEYSAVFMDTGWETQQVYDYIENHLPGIIGNITTIRAQIDLPDDLENIAVYFEDKIGRYSAMVRRVLLYSTFPSRRARWCTDELKMKPMRSHIDAISSDVLNAVGVRAQESSARSKLPEYEYSQKLGCDVWRPILRWSLQDVIDIHHRHGAAPCSQYFNGASRVGCHPCVFARKAELRMMAEQDPSRVELLRELERVVNDLKAKKNKPSAAWFMARTGRTGDFWPIDRVIDWAMTARNRPAQYELFNTPAADTGCVRWGMCDMSTNGGN